ncbi:MAG: hypothetical protein M1824_001582 [Vezdaea acicularis]|nr:MAG: hypothetical protein M1824_001582 [Vezdaea acicularis]
MDLTKTLSRTSSKGVKLELDPFAGHLGHLTAQQKASLEEFKQLCAQEGFFKPPTPENGGKASHDDQTMLRYLRARKFDQKGAFDQFKDTEQWRATNGIDSLYLNIDINEFEETRRLYPQWTGRRDKRGVPVYLFEVSHLSSKTMSAYDKAVGKGSKAEKKVSAKGGNPPKMQRLFALYENLVQLILPICTRLPHERNPEVPITQSNNIVDIRNVGLKQFWNLRSHMQDASVLATAHYPETLDRIFIIGAPSFFPTVWGWIKNWFDPITVSKIFILGTHEVKPTLTRFIDIANIPKRYGGELDYEFGMMPLLDPELANALTWTKPAPSGSTQTFPIGPIQMVEMDDGEVKLLAVGSVDGKERREEIARLHLKPWSPPPDAPEMETEKPPPPQQQPAAFEEVVAPVAGQEDVQPPAVLNDPTPPAKHETVPAPPAPLEPQDPLTTAPPPPSPSATPHHPPPETTTTYPVLKDPSPPPETTTQEPPHSPQPLLDKATEDIALLNLKAGEKAELANGVVSLVGKRERVENGGV